MYVETCICTCSQVYMDSVQGLVVYNILQVQFACACTVEIKEVTYSICHIQLYYIEITMSSSNYGGMFLNGK